MIPKASITAWRKNAPWSEDWQVEQDLILSRALVDLFSRPTVAEQAAFRGGTALHKLFFNPPGRYSEDIDLVQREAGPIGSLMPELLGKKLRALYQRKKGRDLFDLDLALEHAEFDAELLLEAFDKYQSFSGTPVSKAQFEANMAAKLTDATFLSDIPPLLRTGLKHVPAEAWTRLHSAVISKLPGDPWRGTRLAVETILDETNV